MKNKIKYLPIGILTLTTAVSGASLMSSGAHAALNASATASVTVSTACAFSSSATTNIVMSTPPGSYSNTEGIGSRDIVVTCNSSNALSVQAVGVAPHSGSPTTPVQGYNSLYNASENTSIASNTPAAAGASNSYWAFKITSAATTTDATVTNTYSSYSIVPTSQTEVVRYNAATTTSPTSTMTLRTDYQVQVSTNQASGSYTGGVKYVIVDGA